MATSRPETNNNPNRLAEEQQSFEKTIKAFGDSQKREQLQAFESVNSDGMTFAMPDGSFVRIGDAYRSHESAGEVEFDISIAARDSKSTEPVVRRIRLPDRFVNRAAASEDGSQRQTVYDFEDLSGVINDAPKDVRWLIETFGSKLVMERDAWNAIMRLENEQVTLGFDSKNVARIANDYQQAVEHNNQENARVAEEQVDSHFASGFSLMGLRNRLWLQRIEIARRKGKHTKADRIEALIEAGRQNRINKYRGWMDEIDQARVPNSRRYRS